MQEHRSERDQAEEMGKRELEGTGKPWAHREPSRAGGKARETDNLGVRTRAWQPGRAGRQELRQGGLPSRSFPHRREPLPAQEPPSVGGGGLPSQTGACQEEEEGLGSAKRPARLPWLQGQSKGPMRGPRVEFPKEVPAACGPWGSPTSP